MKSVNPFLFKLTRRLFSFFLLTPLLVTTVFFSQVGQAQQTQAQLSLADVLIGLRSKKVTLGERNRLLSDAVKVRGITFSLTPEIETELIGTGANIDLVGAIRQKSVNVKIAAVTEPAVVPVAVTAPVKDFDFYQRQAEEDIGKGEYESAIGSYGKAIDLNPTDAAVYLKRGQAFFKQKSYDLAMLDFNQTLKLNPKNSAGYLNRGVLHEKRGFLPQAISDYQKAVEFDVASETAKSNLKKLQDEQMRIEQAKIEREEVEQAKILAKQKETEAALAAQMPKVPEQPKGSRTVEIGSLVAQAVKMVMPLYPPIARQSKITGQVTVQIEFDEKGNVTAAKAASGPSMLRLTSEEAARRTKFKPAMIADQAVKATGFIVYNFTGN